MTRQKVPFLYSFSCMVSFLTGFPNWSFDFLIRENAKSVASIQIKVHKKTIYSVSFVIMLKL